LLDPLGMKDTTFWPNKEQIARLAKSYEASPSGGPMTEVSLKQVAYPLNDTKHRFPIPAGGLFSTADDCLAFMQMLANHGVYHGTQILTEASFNKMTSVQNKGLGHTQYGLGINARNGNIDHSGHHKTFMGAHMKTGTVLIFMTQVDGKPQIEVDGKVRGIDSLWSDLLNLGDKMNAAVSAKP
jgi:CubicO group peptidase (beta-lactamase class C family)